MLDALTFEKMIKKLEEQQKSFKVIGIIFCNPNHKFAKEQILDRIDQYYYGSSEYIDFYLPGYGAYWNDKYDDKQVVCKVNGIKWYYSEKEYRNFINKLEEVSKWKYSGECEVLFLEYKNKSLDFKNSISIWLDKAIQDKKIYSVPSEFEKIFRYCRSGKNLNQISNKACSKSLVNTGIEEVIKVTGIFGKLYSNSNYAVTKNLNKER
ncbi:hypothetical protein QTG96_12420 [Clostridium perfringens]|nr:hypothetical protein [Clostridium perfringens]